jgi:hypothetical protein
MFKAIPFVLVASLAVVACAGNRPPDSAAPSGGTAASGDTTASSAQGKGSNWADSQRDTFMQGCTSKVNSQDYCSCGFDQFREVFKDGPSQDKDASNDPRFATLGERTKAACASKLPEDVVKKSFLSGCVSDDKRKAPYCECAWPALRKTLSPVDFTSGLEGPKFDDAKKAMVKTCKGKFPVEIAKSDFMTACTKDDAAKGKPCECLWKKIRAKYSTEEIVAGLASIDQVPGIAECK